MQSVDRALAVLEVLAARGSAGVTELGAELGVHKSTASRLLAALERRGFVEQTADRGSFRLGFAVVRLAGRVASQLDLVRQGRAACEALAAEVGETVNLAVLDAGAAVNVSQHLGTSSVTSVNWVGQRTPLHATSSGKVLLAHAPAAVRAAVLAGPLERCTPSTTTDRAALERCLELVRERGWASTEEEYEIGLNAVAAPVRAADGAVVAAVSAAGPAYRLAPADYPRVAARVVAAAAEISRRTGSSAAPSGRAEELAELRRPG